MQPGFSKSDRFNSILKKYSFHEIIYKNKSDTWYMLAAFYCIKCQDVQEQHF